MKVCFEMRVKPDRLAEYRRRHEAVWPEMLRAIERSGRRNYSLFLREDGTIIGYFEVESLDDSQAILAADPVTARWEAEMSDFFVRPEGRADQSMKRLVEVFDLEQQLAAIDS